MDGHEQIRLDMDRVVYWFKWTWIAKILSMQDSILYKLHMQLQIAKSIFLLSSAHRC